jgi:hypothetical protein
MAYFVFLKNRDNEESSLYRIAENLSDLNNFNIFKEDYKIIEDTQENFNFVKFYKKNVLKYSGETIIYEDNIPAIKSKSHAEFKIKIEKEIIEKFLQNNKNHALFNNFNNYLNQLNTLNLDSITYPLNKSLEEYFNDLGQPSYNILQIP